LTGQLPAISVALVHVPGSQPEKPFNHIQVWHCAWTIQMANTRADSVRYSFSQMNPKTLIGLLTFQKKLHRMLQNRDYVVHVSFFTQWKPWHTPSHMARSMRHMIRSKRSTSFTLRHHM
jgi:hypothetical protein